MPALKKIGAAALSAFGFTGDTGLTGQILVIAGGGAGGAAAGVVTGAGGGAGGLCYHAGKPLDVATTYTVVIGAGAAGGATGATQGPSGSNSSFDTIIALGGGGGGAGYAATQALANGVTGGSGGGGGSTTVTSVGYGAASIQGSSGGATGYGFAGGNGLHNAGVNAAGGGGGGAGAAGANVTSANYYGGVGGVGLSTWSSWGAATSTGQNVSGTYYYAGGGGGAGGIFGNNAAGGYGGGAYGGYGGDATQAPNAQANTGGGGGGGPVYTGAGGSGLVIVRYQGSQKFVGGVVTTDGTYIYHTFTTSGSLVPITTPITANFLVVAGGGGAGNGAGAGGAGGFRTSAGTSGGGGSAESALSLSLSTSYTVIVGAGGAGGTGVNGSNSSFGSLITSVGGGACPDSSSNGTSGGSGGGGGRGSNTGGAGTANQGYAGGNAGTTAGGGGGGAGAAGAAGSGNTGGNGGNGVASSISGSSVTYAGGGGAWGNSTGGTGGTGGGGTGIGGSGTGTSGTANLGGGGGAGSTISGQGGSGIVIISYAGSQLFGGGVVTTAAGNTIHTFYTSGTLSPLSTLLANYLIVAGGGGGGYFNVINGGGGGAGGLLAGSNVTIDTNSTYVVSVGAGGATNTQGSNSTFSTVSTNAVGGGYGGYASGSSYIGGNGGSGGGAGQENPASTSHNGGSGVIGQGNKGGASAYGSGGSYVNAGGGGGAGQAGFSATASNGGNGGNGSVSSISGTAIYYAGGGGGLSGGSGSGITTGGLGGGGNGGWNGGSVSGVAGSANTGGGGGGGNGGTNTAGAGGSGVVIIAYPGSTQRMAGGAVTVVNNTTVHTFTTSGYLSPLTYFGNSLRFRGSNSAYLSRTPTVASNRTTWTWSAWVKKGTIGTTYSEMFSAGTSGGSQDNLGFYTDKMFFYSAALGTLRVSTAIYRDPAAWYHIVCALDTTQSSASNRLRIYVNGSEITAWDTNTTISQNQTFLFNNTNLHALCAAPGYSQYFDSYVTNVNFVDGQQLAPTAFGAFNSYGVWQPVTYGGSYGTNGFFLPFNVDRSQYSYAFNTTPSYLTSSTAGIMPLGNTTWSIECWAWFNALPSSNMSFIMNSATGGVQIFYRPAVNTVEIGASGAADVLVASITVNTLVLNAWNHFTFTSNGTQLRIFLNGMLIGYTSSSYSFAASQSVVFIGNNSGGTSSDTLNGFISNLRVCNGSIPTSYQTSATTIGTQVFSPPTTALTTTSQGAANVTLLTCQSATIVDNSSSPKTLSMTGTVTPSTIGPSSNPFYDKSPQGNNWTPNNISLVNGSTLDSVTDVPTLSNTTSANYCVLNPLDQGTNVTLSNGNLQYQLSGGGNNGMVRTTIAIPTSGKWYCEALKISYGNLDVGVATARANLSSYIGSDAYGWGYFSADGVTYNNGVGVGTTGATLTTNDILGVAFDSDAGTLKFYKNNTLQNTVSGFTPTTVTYFFAAGSASGGGILNFGQQPFTYTPPTGYIALNAYNM